LALAWVHEFRASRESIGVAPSAAKKKIPDKPIVAQRCCIVVACVNLTLNHASGIAVGTGPSQFEKDGYTVLEGYFAPAQIDRAAAAVRRVLAEKPRQVVVDSLRTGARTFWAHASEASTRQFKFNDLYLMCNEVRDLALEPGLCAILGELLREPAVLCNSLNFEKGSSQPKHIDSLYMTPRTPHALIAVWIAFEDVHPDSGPLAYYPGSHRIPLYTFNDGTHHASRDEIVDWFDYIDVQLRLRGMRERKLLARKGDVFIWHADLVHGGSPIADDRRTRSSLVCHYFGEADCVEKGMDLVPMNGAFWMRRQQQPVKVDPALFGGSFPFPEERYLERYPDVHAAVTMGQFPSGETHYRNFGFAEGRGV
jgi:ectoine hydroxylase-related dioxygenase (phytanoyl-CoA dioxygenase family)